MLHSTLRASLLMMLAAGLLASCDYIRRVVEAIEGAEVEEVTIEASGRGVVWENFDSSGRCDAVPLEGSVVRRSALPELRRTESAAFVSAVGYELRVGATSSCTRHELYAFQSVFTFDTSALSTRLIREAWLELDGRRIDFVGGAASSNVDQCLTAATVGGLVSLPRQPRRQGPPPATSMLRGPATVAGAIPLDGHRANVTGYLRPGRTAVSLVVSPDIEEVRAQTLGRDRDDQELLCAQVFAGARLHVRTLAPR
jgi:hypothetical protein